MSWKKSQIKAKNNFLKFCSECTFAKLSIKLWFSWINHFATFLRLRRFFCFYFWNSESKISSRNKFLHSHSISCLLPVDFSITLLTRKFHLLPLSFFTIFFFLIIIMKERKFPFLPFAHARVEIHITLIILVKYDV